MAVPFSIDVCVARFSRASQLEAHTHTHASGLRSTAGA